MGRRRCVSTGHGCVSKQFFGDECHLSPLSQVREMPPVKCGIPCRDDVSYLKTWGFSLSNDGKSNLHGSLPLRNLGEAAGMELDKANVLLH